MPQTIPTLIRGKSLIEFRPDGPFITVACAVGGKATGFDVLEREQARGHWRRLIWSGYRERNSFRPMGA